MLKSKNVVKVIAVLAMLVMTSVMLAGCEFKKSNSNNDSTEKFVEPIDNFIYGLGEANSEKFVSAFPDFLKDYMGSIFTNDYLAETIKKAETVYGTNIKMSYSVSEKKDIAEEDLRSMEQNVKTTFDKDIKITKGYDVTIDIKTTGDTTEDIEQEIISVYQIDGNWYLLNI